MLTRLKPLLMASGLAPGVVSERRRTERVGRESFYFSLFPFLKGGLSLVLWKPSVSARLVFPAAWDSLVGISCQKWEFPGKEERQFEKPLHEQILFTSTKLFRCH